jgi:hypothetical protein
MFISLGLTYCKIFCIYVNSSSISITVYFSSFKVDYLSESGGYQGCDYEDSIMGRDAL